MAGGHEQRQVRLNGGRRGVERETDGILAGEDVAQTGVGPGGEGVDLDVGVECAEARSGSSKKPSLLLMNTPGR